MSSCAKETCIHSSVCMYYADRCTTNGDCGDFKPPQPKRPHGEWIDHQDDGYVECPFCGSATNCEDGGKEDLHYCFSCGASMGVNQNEL